MSIKITAKKDGFWRCGVQHFGTQIYSDNKFTAEQLERLKAEQMLVVEEVKETSKGK